MADVHTYSTLYQLPKAFKKVPHGRECLFEKLGHILGDGGVPRKKLLCCVCYHLAPPAVLGELAFLLINNGLEEGQALVLLLPLLQPVLFRCAPVAAAAHHTRGLIEYRVCGSQIRPRVVSDKHSASKRSRQGEEKPTEARLCGSSPAAAS